VLTTQLSWPRAGEGMAATAAKKENLFENT